MSKHTVIAIEHIRHAESSGQRPPGYEAELRRLASQIDDDHGLLWISREHMDAMRQRYAGTAKLDVKGVKLDVRKMADGFDPFHRKPTPVPASSPPAKAEAPKLTAESDRQTIARRLRTCRGCEHFVKFKRKKFRSGKISRLVKCRLQPCSCGQAVAGTVILGRGECPVGKW